MRIYKILIFIVLLTIITIGGVSAADNSTQNDTIASINDASDTQVDETCNGDEILAADEGNNDLAKTAEDSTELLAGNESNDDEYYLFRGDCWTIVNNFESSAAITSESVSDFTVTGTFRTENDIIGLYWNSKDPITHPYISYGNRSDYSNVKLEFDYEMSGCIDFKNATINIMIVANTGETYYLTMNRFIENNHVSLDFNNLTLLPGNTYFDRNGTPMSVSQVTRLNVSDLKFIMFQLVPENFTQNNHLTIMENVDFTCRISNITVSNATICKEQPQLEPHQYRLCEGYDDSYNLNPFRLSREMRKLGYTEWVDLYIGASYYYEKSGTIGDVIDDANFDHNRTEKMVLDKNVPLNAAFRAWLDCYSRELKKNGVTNLVISVSMENLQCPESWRQMDANGNFAMTGWNPSTFFYTPCNEKVVSYMQNVSEACLDIVVRNGLRPILQMGESWWWWNEIDRPNQPPCFYDNSTKAKYLAEKGTELPEYTNVWTLEYDKDVVDWVNRQLVLYSDALCEVVNGDKYSNGLYMALFFPPSVIDSDRVPQMIRDANYLKDAYSPSKLDVMQIEDYDWVIFESQHHKEAYTIGGELGFDESRQHYFGGFVQYGKDADEYWPLIQDAMDYAIEMNFSEVYVWAGSQVRRDNKILGYDEYVILENLKLTNEPGIVSPIITAPDYANTTENFTISMRTSEWASGIFNVYEYKNGEKGKLMASNEIINGSSSVILSSYVGGLNKFYLEFNYTGGKYHLIREVYLYKLSTNMTADDINADYGNDTNLTITLRDEKGNSIKDKNISINLNGKNKTITTDNNGQASLPIDLACGNYTATISFNEDDTYKASAANTDIIINKIDSILYVDDVVMDYGTSIDVNVTAEGATRITAKIDGNDTLVNGSTIPITGLKAGTYTLTVTTVPDENHTAINKTVAVTVNKVNSTLTVDNVSMDYESSFILNVTAEGATRITAKIDGNDTLVNGSTIPITGLKAGTYTLTVTTVPDENHTAVTKTATITVNKINSTLTVEDVELDYGETVSVNVTAKGTKGITAKIDGKNITLTGYTITISCLKAGNHTLTVTTIPDENHTAVTKTANITVNKISSTVDVNDVYLDYGETANVTATTEGAEGIAAKINKEEATVIGNNIQIPILNATTYNLTVTTVPDENHTSASKTVTITVNKINSTLTVDDVELDYESSINVTVKTEGAIAITAKIDDKNITANNFTIPISDLDAGNYTLTITTIPDTNHIPITKSVNVNVKKINSTLTVDDVELDYESSINVTVKTEGAIAITAKIDDKNITANNFTIPISDLNAGNYTLTITTIPDTNHIPITKSVNVNVKKINSTLTVDDVELDYESSINVTVKTKGVIAITAKINDKNITANNFTIPISNLDAGNYTLTITTIPDKNHITTTKTANITVNKINSTLTVDNVNLDYENSINVTVKTEGATDITAKIDDKDIEVNNFTIPISGLKAGTYLLTVTTIPDKNHIATTKTANITVNKINSTLTVDNVNLDYESSINITVKTEGASGITAKINDKNITANNFTIPISDLDAGNYTLTITTIPDTNHIPITKSVNVTVRKINSTLTVDNVNLDYESSTNVTVKTKGATGITAKINDKNITANNFTIPISDLDAGNYTLTITTIPDKNHITTTKTANITVNKINSTLNADDVKLDYGSSVIVNVTTQGSIGIIAKIDNESADVNEHTIPISGLKAGNHTLTITTIPDTNHNPVNKSVNVNVRKINSTIDVNDTFIDYGKSTNIKVITEGADGFTAKINGKEVNIINNLIPVSDLKAGNYNLTIITIPDENHTAVTKTAAITVRKINSTLTVDNVNLDYENSTTVNVIAEGATGITVKIDDTDIEVNNFTVPISGLDAGNYTLTVSTIPDENHTAVTKTANITVNKINSTLTVENVILDYNDSTDVNVTAHGSTGITVKINDKEVSANEYTIPISGLNAGNYTLTVTTIPDNNHNPITKTANITVRKINSTLTAGNIEMDYNDSIDVNVTTNGTTGITAQIDNKTVNVNNYTIPITGLNAGNHTLTITTIPDENHISVNKSVNVNVKKINSTLTAGNIEMDYNDSIDVNVTTNGTTGITAQIDGKNAIVNDYTILIANLNAGNHTLTITTIPDKNHKAITKTANITVNKINSTLTADNVNIDYGKTTTVNVTTDGAIGITAKINAEATAVNGNSIPIPILNAGTYNLTITTIPDSNHTEVTKTVTITVNKVNSTLTVKNVEIDYNDSIDVNVTAEGTTGITSKIDNETINVTNYTIPIANLKAGNHTLTVTTIPDDNHNPVTKTATITVNKIDSTLTVKNVDLDYGTSFNVNVTTQGATGITAKIGDEPVSVNGNSIPIPILNAGNHTLTITTIPDENHTTVTKTATITVNKINSTIDVNDTTMNWEESTNITAITKGTKGFNAKIDNKEVNIINNQIPISNLKAGTHTLTITTIPDENHTAVTKTATITVNKINSTLTADNVNIDYGNSANVNVTAEGTTGITAQIDNKTIRVNDYTITISGLNAGNHTLTITTIPDENHTAVTKTATITVNKIDSTLTVENVTLDYDSSINVTVTTEGTTGITAKINDKELPVNNYTLPLANLNAGNYTLTVTTIPDKNHNPVNKSVNVNVKKINSTLTVKNVEIDYDTSIDINVTTNGTTGITAQIDGKAIPVNNYTITISNLSAGNHTLTVTTIPDSNHNPTTKSANVNVKKINSTLTVKNVELDYNDSIDINVTTEGTTGITAQIGGKDTIVNDYTILIANLNAGNHTLTITTIPDENHKAITKTATITVNKINSTIDVNDTIIDWGESTNITAITKGAKHFSAKINNKEVNIINNQIPISNLKAGNHTLTITTIPDENHKAITKTATITVNKVKSTIEVNDVNIDYGKTTTVNVTTEGAAGITAKINTEKIIFSGTSIPIPKLNANTYTLTVKTIPDENHTETTKTATITVNKVNSTLTLENIELDYCSSVNVTVTTEGTTGITAKIEGNDAIVNDYTITIANLKAGNHTLTVTTIPDSNHKAVAKSVNINVNKLKTNLATNDINVKYGDATNLIITLKDEKENLLADKNISINLNGSNHTATTNKNGQATLHIDLLPGNFISEILFNGDDSYLPSTTHANIIINKLTTAVAANDINVKYGKDTNLIITLKDEKENLLSDKNISININGARKTITTNKNGQATLPIALGCGNYTANIAFGGDEKHSASSATAKIAIGQLSSKMTAPAISTTYNVAKNLIVTLKDENNNAIAGENVIIKLNNHVYNKTTDSNGQVKLSVNLPAKSYIADIHFEGSATYKPSTTTAKVTVAKATPKLAASSRTFYIKVKNKKVTATLKSNKNAVLKNTVVKLTVNKKTYKAKTNSKGIATFKVKLTKKGKYNAVIKYGGSSNYKSVSKKIKITIK